MITFRDCMKADLENVIFNMDENAVEIDWDNDRIVAIVSDVESVDNKDFDEGIESIIERKMITIMQDAVNVKPAIDDQVRLNLDPAKVDFGDYWIISKVDEPDGMYEIYFYRNVT